MLNSLFSSRHSTPRQELSLIEQLNTTDFKKNIILDFISNFIDNTPNDAKINKIIQILKDTNVFLVVNIYMIYSQKGQI